jgi:hypothetical protein
MATRASAGVAALLLIFALGAAVRAIGVTRPADQADWREIDVSSVARNFHREGMNPLLPRIDWRGDGPGFTEMEFPFQSFGMALLYGAFGVEEWLGRAIAYGWSLVALAAFLALAASRLSGVGACAAGLAFALSPLPMHFATALQPEGMMLATGLLAVLSFVRLLDGGRRAWLVAAGVLLALALLAKPNAAHLGLLFAALVLRRFGLGALRQGRLWALAIASVAPAALWLAHARGLYLGYGNSLGLSNEYHWIGLDLLWPPRFLLGIARSELDFVWTLPGALLLAGVAALERRRLRIELELFWLAAVFTYYVAAGRTTGDAWAYYYHVASAPPVALLFGHAAASVAGLFQRSRLGALPPARRALAFGAVAVGAVLLAGVYLHGARRVWWRLEPRPASPLFACAQRFAAQVPEGERIAASGGVCRDPTGRSVAYNAPYFFYWMDRKGWNLCVEEQSIENLARLRERGARFFVSETARAQAVPGFEDALAGFREVDACPEARLFALDGAGGGASR